MKDEFKAIERYLKQLEALKNYDKVKRQSQELKAKVTQVEARLSQMQAEKDKLENESLLKERAEEEVSRLREALDHAERELSTLRGVQVMLDGAKLTLEEAMQQFVQAEELEIRARLEKEFEELKKDFEVRMPQLVYQKLVTILKGPEWPPEIAQVIEGKAEQRAQGRLDDEFQRKVGDEAAARLEELKRGQWKRFVQEQASRLSRGIRPLVAELRGPWVLLCDRCGRRVTVTVSGREMAILLKGGLVAECPDCTDFNLPPHGPFTPHKIPGSALEDFIEARLRGTGLPD